PHVSDLGQPSLFDGGLLQRLCAMGAGGCQSRFAGRATGRAGYPRLRFDRGATSGFVQGGTRLLQRAPAIRQSDGAGAIFLLRGRRSDRTFWADSNDTPGIPRRAYAYQPRRVLFSLHLVAGSASASYERLFPLAIRRAGTQGAGGTGKPHRYL